MDARDNSPLPTSAYVDHTRSYDAVIFDMDGVVTRTATVHAKAWKHTFDLYLAHYQKETGIPSRPYQHPTDYLAHIDGRPRIEGVEVFLRSRGITLPLGSPNDEAGYNSFWAIGNLKNRLFNETIERNGVEVFQSTITLIHALRAQGIHVGLATSSRNAALILSATGTASLFETVVDGLVSASLSLRGKPAPDIFIEASARLGVPPGRAIVVEDAASGVKAASCGGFALALGIAREGNEQELLKNGADTVVADLEGIGPLDLDLLVRTHHTSPSSH